MPRDFKTFAKEHEEILNKDNEKTEQFEEILNKYKDMNNNDLMSSLLSEASKLKSEGKLDPNSIASLQSTLAPFLDSEQKNMLKSIINAINEQK